MGLIRKTDALIRYGGDEFLLVMPNVSEEDFEKKLEEIQYQIHMIQIPDSRGDVHCKETEKFHCD